MAATARFGVLRHLFHQRTFVSEIRRTTDLYTNNMCASKYFCSSVTCLLSPQSLSELNESKRRNSLHNCGYITCSNHGNRTCFTYSPFFEGSATATSLHMLAETQNNCFSQRRLCHSESNKSDVQKRPAIKSVVSTKVTQTKARIVDTKEKLKDSVEGKFKEIQENVLTIPNVLSTMRILMSPVIGYLVLDQSYGMAATLFVVAGMSDLLDGYIARNFDGQTSVLGSVLDPFADKVLISVLIVTLTINELLPIPLTALILARDGILMGTGFWLRYISLPPPLTMRRYFDIKHATTQLQPTAVSKVNTAVQLSLIALTIAAPIFHFVDHQFLHALWYITGATTVLSGLSYMVQRDTFKILHPAKKRGQG